MQLCNEWPKRNTNCHFNSSQLYEIQLEWWQNESKLKSEFVFIILWSKVYNFKKFFSFWYKKKMEIRYHWCCSLIEGMLVSLFKKNTIYIFNGKEEENFQIENQIFDKNWLTHTHRDCYRQNNETRKCIYSPVKRNKTKQNQRWYILQVVYR